MTTVFGGITQALGVAVQSDGRIVAAGGTSSPFGADFALARYKEDGSLDTTFDGDGKVTTDFGGSDGASGIAIRGDGKIVAAGNGGPTFDFAVARYNADGSLDSGFDGDGKVLTDFGDFDRAEDVAIQPDGKIVTAGVPGSGSFALARYSEDGSLDTTFDGDGKVTTDFGGDDRGRALALQTDGKIVAVGFSLVDANPRFAVARYDSNGSLDPSFGVGGRVTTDFGNPADVGVLCPPSRIDCSNDIAEDVAIQANGRIVAAGGAGACSPACLFALARYEGDRVDDTPPVIIVPGDITVDATGPNGAVVSYAASAVDDVDGSVPVTCVPPSGSTFPIGTTTVSCDASDAAGNSANASFNVHVKGADEQLDDLLELVVTESLGPGNSFSDKLRHAQDALAAGDQTATCEHLDAFRNQVQAQFGKKLTPAEATELVDAANRIQAVLDC